jgi:hypothetical protein
MHATPRIRTPMPPRPVVASAAVDSTHRLLAALIDQDLGGAEGLFEPSACVWWSQRGALASVEGAHALTRALAELIESAPPTRIAIVGSIGGSSVTSAYVDDVIAWTLEMRVRGDRITGVYLRGAHLAGQ